MPWAYYIKLFSGSGEGPHAHYNVYSDLNPRLGMYMRLASSAWYHLSPAGVQLDKDKMQLNWRDRGNAPWMIVYTEYNDINTPPPAIPRYEAVRCEVQFELFWSPISDGAAGVPCSTQPEQFTGGLSVVVGGPQMEENRNVGSAYYLKWKVSGQPVLNGHVSLEGDFDLDDGIIFESRNSGGTSHNIVLNPSGIQLTKTPNSRYAAKFEFNWHSFGVNGYLVFYVKFLGSPSFGKPNVNPPDSQQPPEWVILKTIGEYIGDAGRINK